MTTKESDQKKKADNNRIRTAKNIQQQDRYLDLLEQIKNSIRTAQIRTSKSINTELILLYWQIGHDILDRQSQEGWGAKVVERLAADLRREFPGMKGMSRANLMYMRAFASAYPDRHIVQQIVGQIPWGQNIALLDRLKETSERLWYARQAILNSWSRAVLIHQIESGLFDRQGSAVTNFDQVLPSPHGELAIKTLKDPYVLDFLCIDSGVREREMEKALMDHLQKFLIELGSGFAFVGRQYHLEISGRDYYIDLLFYHLNLRCYVVLDLKVEEFRPEFAGKMNFYLSAVDDLLKHPDDNASIGLILCRGRDRLTVEYALKDTRKPVGVSEYRLTSSLPGNLETSLPTAEQLENVFRKK